MTRAAISCHEFCGLIRLTALVRSETLASINFAEVLVPQLASKVNEPFIGKSAQKNAYLFKDRIFKEPDLCTIYIFLEGMTREYCTKHHFLQNQSQPMSSCGRDESSSAKSDLAQLDNILNLNTLMMNAGRSYLPEFIVIGLDRSLFGTRIRNHRQIDSLPGVDQVIHIRACHCRRCITHIENCL